MDRFSRQKISKDIVGVKSIIHQVDLVDISGALYPPTAECASFSSYVVHSAR
jgi:hypothetical protein